jgi:hypothetical protein
MMRRALWGAAIILALGALARAQMPTPAIAPTPPASDTSDRIVTTAWPGTGWRLAGFANNVNFNAVGDTTLNLGLSSTNYAIFRIAIINQGTTASLTTAQFNIFSAQGGAGTPLFSAAQNMSPLTSNVANASGGIQYAQPVSAYWNFNPIYFRITTPQGAAASGSVYIYVLPLP